MCDAWRAPRAIVMSSHALGRCGEGVCTQPRSKIFDITRTDASRVSSAKRNAASADLSAKNQGCNTCPLDICRMAQNPFPVDYETAVLVAEPDGTLRERRDDEVTNASSQHATSS